METKEIDLLAKSRKEINGTLRQGCYLSVHTFDVVKAADTIIQAIGDALQGFFKLTDAQMKTLRATALVAAFCHDLGKANDSFQQMINNQRRDQTIRHEHLSTLLMSLPQVRVWLEQFPDVDYELARLVVIGHHLKAVDDDSLETKGRRIKPFARSLNEDDEFLVCSGYRQFSDLLGILCSIEPSLPEPDFVIPQHWSFYDEDSELCVEQIREQIIDELQALVSSLRKDKPRQRLLWAARAIFFAADASASGLRRIELEQMENQSGEGIESWIHDSLLRGKTASDIGRVLDKRKKEVIKRERAKGNEVKEFKEKDFQLEAAKLGERALLLAPCGSGKTIAAYLWIQKQLETRCGWKVVFLYPTTGTATEGFKDYASHDEDAALVHSRAAFDLEGMFENPDDERGKNNFNVDQRLYALGYWPDAIFSATADAFLSFLQNHYSSLCLLPVLARSVIVIDEIHSFDYAMFDALIEFLREFDAPVLLMTASLQKQRREKLECLFPEMKIYPQASDMEQLEELRESAECNRYCVEYYKNDWEQGDAWKIKDKLICPTSLIQLALQAYDEEFKVLWVVNTVDRCMGIAKALQRERVLCYHSRFKYCDRIERHREVVNAFQLSQAGGVIAVTTQVCEMSLDLDADVLITELAPASSLIQRMGRCNRSIKGKPPEKHGRVYIYDPIDPKPYDEEVFRSGNVLLSSLNSGEPIKQSQLASALDNIVLGKEKGKRCLFTMPMWQAYSGNDFRDIDEFTVSAVLESEVETFQRLQLERDNRSAGLILQAPRRLCLKDNPYNIWLPVVPDKKKKDSIRYNKKYGLHEV
jgi:CRISPR-associated endonuclease/helicase Cas3